MTRSIGKLSEHTHLVWGTDHVLGNFIDVTDVRYANSGQDEQGEGYLLEYSALFKFTNNLIEATEDDLFSLYKGNKEPILLKVETFIAKLYENKKIQNSQGTPELP